MVQPVKIRGIIEPRTFLNSIKWVDKPRTDTIILLDFIIGTTAAAVVFCFLVTVNYLEIVYWLPVSSFLAASLLSGLLAFLFYIYVDLTVDD